MTRHFSPPSRQAAVTAAILIGAARCWRGARDGGQPVLPCLSRMLAAHDCTILAPVFDSLIRFYESAIGRPIAVGDAAAPSEDEHRLLGLLDGTCPHTASARAQTATRALDCALCSTRIMLALTLGHPARPLQ